MTSTMFTCEAFVEVKKNNADTSARITDTASKLGVDEDVARRFLEQQGEVFSENEDEDVYYEYFDVAFDLCSITRVEEYVFDDETSLATVISDDPRFFYHLNVDFRVIVEAWVKAKTGSDTIMYVKKEENSPQTDN